MDPVTATLILTALDIGLLYMTRAPSRDLEKEAAVRRVQNIVTNGGTPTQEDHDIILAVITLNSQERDELIAAKPE